MNGLRAGTCQWRTELSSALLLVVIYPRYLAPGPSESSHAAMLRCRRSGMSAPAPKSEGVLGSIALLFGPPSN